MKQDSVQHPKASSKITDDQLSNELLLINHHLNDMEEGLKDGDTSYVQKSITDVKEIISRMNSLLPPAFQAELIRTGVEPGEDSEDSENSKVISEPSPELGEPAEGEPPNEDDTKEPGPIESEPEQKDEVQEIANNIE